MNRVQQHRGPDDTGIYISSHRRVGLGHQRLSIIDTSPAGHQPMRYLDRYVITFNGEMYNFQTERRALEQAGYKFKSHTDTEVILALYDKYGPACLDHIRGMFAFAIYDEQQQTLFCARDRLGKKPFKYYLDNSVFLFASELKAILTQPEYQRAPDYTAIHHYLTLQYCPAPFTGFRGIKKLPPAHYLLINLASGQTTLKRYWQLSFGHKLKLSENEWRERIIQKLTEAVRLRMIADVPIGAFLSGGIDSGAIVALMSQLSARPVKTFSIGFAEQQYNELPYARLIAERYHTDHTEFIVKPNATELLPDLIHHYEEPYADSSALPTYYVSQLARQHVTVALNGDGGDENFAGYGRYSVQQFSLAYEKLLSLHRATALPVARFARRLRPTTLFDRALRFSETLPEDYRRRYVNYICYFTSEQKHHLYTDTFARDVETDDSYDIITEQFMQSGSRDKLDQTLYADIMTYLPDDLLTKVDIASMAVSLEARSPFLDHEFMELTAQIPSRLKLRGRNNKKYILKSALGGLLPNTILDRPKMGFGVPLDIWFRGPLRSFTHDTLLSTTAHSRGLFRPEAVTKLLHDHENTRINYANHIWALLTLELWFQKFFDTMPQSQSLRHHTVHHAL